MRGNVSIQRVVFAYPNRPKHNVLNGLNISASEGQTIALVGPSGQGKVLIF